MDKIILTGLKPTEKCPTNSRDINKWAKAEARNALTELDRPAGRAMRHVKILGRHNASRILLEVQMESINAANEVKRRGREWGKNASNRDKFGITNAVTLDLRTLN